MAPVSRTTAAVLDQGAAAASDPPREFAFSEADFRFLAQLAYERAAIVLGEGKRNLVYGRLSRRLRALGLSSFLAYREFLTGPDGAHEIESFINSISTNHTKLFREHHHFAHLADQVVSSFAKSLKGGPGRLRIWSAGCSTGEEPYSIALVLKREIPAIERHDVKILATDIDTDVLTKAKRGEYPASALQEVPEECRKYFDEAKRSGAALTMSDAVRSLITFRQLNLIQPWPFKGPFDAIFCRNVMIYFDQPTKSGLIERFTGYLKPGGTLYIGHSEALIGSHPQLHAVGRTIYRRTA